MIVIARLTQAQAATIVNAVFTVIQYTFGLAVVVLLVYFMHNVNSAITWSGVTRTLHSSIWPILLRTDSTSSGGRWSHIYILSNLSILGGVLVAIAGVVTPLGLNEGPLVQTEYVSMGASYIADLSPIGRATSPREKFSYSRICGAWGPVPCPGNGLNGNTSQISPQIVETFSSTPYGPFNMQFRRYYQGTGGYDYPMIHAKKGTVESLILRNDILSIEGLIVDLTNKPGIGLWNHTLPILRRGGVWSEDVLWLEPVTSCANTNLTIDYQQKHSPAQILNTIWTDKAANYLVGTNTATSLTVAPYVPSVAYDWRYGIPAVLLICIWLPLFLIATFILLSKRLRILHLRHLLYQTSIGRVLIGDSSIRASPLDPHGDSVGSCQLQPFLRHQTGHTETSHLDTKDWTKKVGQTPVALDPVASITEATSHSVRTLGAEGAGEQWIALMPGNGDLSRKRRTLRAALREYVQFGRSHVDTDPKSSRTASVV